MKHLILPHAKRPDGKYAMRARVWEQQSVTCKNSRQARKESGEENHHFGYGQYWQTEQGKFYLYLTPRWKRNAWRKHNLGLSLTHKEAFFIRLELHGEEDPAPSWYY